MNANAMRACLTVAAVLAMLRPAAALEGTSPSPGAELHQRLLSIALDNIDKAYCERGRACAPATTEERVTPPITDDQARAIVTAGTISVLAQHCNLEWERRNLEPLMSYYRQTLKMTGRQIALVGLLHGIAMGAAGETVRKTPCSPQMKSSVAARLLAP